MRTRDVQLIWRIMTEPHNWRITMDDWAGEAHEWWPIVDESRWYVLAYDASGNLLGMLIVLWHSRCLGELHLRWMKCGFGRATEGLQEFMAWLWGAAKDLHRVVAPISTDNELATLCAVRNGFERWGINPACVRKGGKYIDQHWYGITRPVLGLGHA